MVRADLVGTSSTTGALQGAWALSTAHFVVLRQQLVDCDIVDQSCDDGWAHKQCFCLRRKQPHLHKERYSYVGTKGTCLASSCTVGFAQGVDTGFTEVTTKNVQALKDALAQLPVSIAIGNDSIYLCSHGAMPWGVLLYSGDGVHFWCGPHRGLRHGRHHGLLEGQESLETHVD